MLTEEALKHTPLYEDHLALRAKMVPFGGWDMPVQYEGILAEYEKTRKEATLFDICHMGEFRVIGDCLASGLDRIVTMSLKDLPIKESRYGMILNDKGGVIDDLIIFREDKDRWFIVVNGATTAKDAAHFERHLKKGTFENLSAQLGKLDLQGPASRAVLKKFVPTIDRLKYFTFDYFDLLGTKTLISRTGYTGELGYEIFFPRQEIVRLWRQLLKDPCVKPAGLGVRDMLRLEVGYSLYGHELDEQITPLESGLSRFIDFNKDFVGKEALLKQKTAGLTRKLVGFISDNRRPPRAEQKIYSKEQEPMGVVTSGTFSPYLDKGIGCGFVKPEFGAGEKIYFGDDKTKTPATIGARIFYKSDSLKS